MLNIQETLDSLQPYVIGIRYLEGTALVDVVFKDGWTVQEQAKIKTVKGDDGMNYYMIFSESKGIGLDELLAYVGKIIKINIEREKKHELLKLKVDELKIFFKQNPLDKLVNLKFTLTEEDLVPKLDEFDLDEEIYDEPVEEVVDEVIEELYVEETTTETPLSYLDENHQPIEMTEEDLEILEEEARAEKNRLFLESKKKDNKVSKISKKVELPPKRKLEIANDSYSDSDCDCDGDSACEKCIDTKY